MCFFESFMATIFELGFCKNITNEYIGRTLINFVKTYLEVMVRCQVAHYHRFQNLINGDKNRY